MAKPKPLLTAYAGRIDELTDSEVVQLYEEVRQQLEPLTDLFDLVKGRLKTMLGDATEKNIMVPSKESTTVLYPFRVYKQFRKKYEQLTMFEAEQVIEDRDLLEVICPPRTVDFKLAKEALPDEIVKQLEQRRTELEPTTIIKVAMAKKDL